MSDQRISFCYTRYTDGLCGRPVTPGLPVCSDCLRRILEEEDPRHRRTLAASPQLAIGLVHRLADDPDEGVRAQIAARTDLDTPTGNLLGNPDRELSPVVWRSLAGGPGAVAHAWELMGTDDPTTLAILAANPGVDPDVLEQLARHPNPDIAWTASATLQQQPPNQAIADRIAAARSFNGLPLDELVVPMSSMPAPAPPTAPVAAGAAPPSRTNGPPDGASQATLTRPAPPDAAPNKRAGLVIGVVAAAVAVVVIVAIVLTRGGSGSKSTDFGMGPPLTGTARTLGPGETSTTSSTRPPTTTPTTPPTTEPAPTTTVPPTQPPPQTQPGPVIPNQPGPITQSFQILPGAGQFCHSAQVTVNFSPSPGYVVVTDDSGSQVAAWSGPSGQTQSVNLPRSTSSLTVTVTATGSSISVSGSASGGSC